MTSDVDIVNQALLSIGEQTTVQSINPSSGGAAADAAAILYQSKIDALFRAAPWNFARKQVFLTQLRAVSIDGVLSDDPPPQPWQYEYSYPADCIKARYILPNFRPSSSSIALTTATNYGGRAWLGEPLPYIVALDVDPSEENDIKVILTNVYQAQLVYTKRVGDPNLWDPAFINAATQYLAVWLLNALSRDRGGFSDQIRLAMDIINTARVDDGNEGNTTVDNTPDWIRIRGGGWPTAAAANLGWEPLSWPGGIFL